MEKQHTPPTGSFSEEVEEAEQFDTPPGEPRELKTEHDEVADFEETYAYVPPLRRSQRKRRPLKVFS